MEQGTPETRRQRVLLQASEWAHTNKVLLDLCFAEFSEKAEWPRLETIEHRLELGGHTITAATLAYQMPSALGFVEGGRLILLCRALAHIDAANDLLKVWFSAVRQAYLEWKNDPGSEFSSEQVAALVDDDHLTLRQASELLLRESWMFGSGVGDASGDWTREITAGVRVAREAENAAELLDARATVEWSDPEPPAAIKAVEPETRNSPDSAVGSTRGMGQLGLVRRFWRYANEKPILAGLAVLAIVGLLGLAYGAGRKLVESQDSQSSTTAGGRIERAAEGGARTFAVPGELSREGPKVDPNQRLRVTCRVHAPRPPSVKPDGYWYKLASSPWNGHYFAPANSFWNGDVPGGPTNHNTDFSVQVCG